MYRPQLPNATKRTPFNKKHQQDLVDNANANYSLTGGGENDVHNTPQGKVVVPPKNFNPFVPVVVKITSLNLPLLAGGTTPAGIGWYSARLQEPTPKGFKPKTDFVYSDYYRDRSGQDDLYVVNRSDEVAGSSQLAVGDYAEGYFTWSIDDKTLVYRAVVEIPASGGGALTIGMYQGQFYGNITDNQAGFTFPFLCPEL